MTAVCSQKSNLLNGILRGRKHFKWTPERTARGMKKITIKYVIIVEPSYMSRILRLTICIQTHELQQRKISKKAIEESPNLKAGYTKNISKAILKRKSFIANELRKIKE